MIKSGFEINECCPKMVAMLENDNLVGFIGAGVDTGGVLPLPPGTYICSDGGHGGMEMISFCPWCGSPIEIVEIVIP